MEHNNKQSGFSLAEVLVGIFIIGVLATILTGGILYGTRAAANAGLRARGVLLAEEGLEATRNIRDASFTNLVNGTYGLAVSGGQWVFSGSSDSTGVYTRTITIATVDTVTKQITSTVTWNQSGQPQGSVVLVTDLGNIGLLNQQSASLVVDTSGANFNANDFRGLTLTNTGSSSITISTMTVSWTNLLRLMTQIRINATTVWSGSVSSGTNVNNTDVVIAPGTTIPLDRLRFNGNMAGNAFVIIFNMSDGSSKTVTYP